MEGIINTQKGMCHYSNRDLITLAHFFLEENMNKYLLIPY